MSDIKIRDFKKSDIKDLSLIVMDTWGFSDSFSMKLAVKMSRLYLAEALNESNFCKVAEADGEAVGFIAARSDMLKKGSLKSKIFVFKALFPVIFNIEAIRAVKVFWDMSKLNKRLYKKAGIDFEGEITLFVLNIGARGKGIGGRLYSDALDFIRRSGAGNYYIYTDTTCDYKFYEHKGAKKLSCEELFIPL